MGELYSRRSFLAGALTAGMLSTSAGYLLTRRRSITLTLAAGADVTGGRDELVTMWNQLNPDVQIRTQTINSSTQDQFDKFIHSDADIFALDLIHIPKFVAEHRIHEFDPQNDMSLLGPLARACRVSGSGAQLWAAPWNADVGVLYRRVTSRAAPGDDYSLKDMFAARPGSVIGQLQTVGSQTDEAYVVNVLEHALAQDPQIIGTNGAFSGSLDQWQHALTPLADALRTKRFVAVGSEKDSLDGFEQRGLTYMRNWPVYYPAVDRTERIAGNALSVQLSALQPGILGGQALAVSERSAHRSDAIRAIRFLTDIPAQLLLATYGFAPTCVEAYTDERLKEARPELDPLIRSAVQNAMSRPTLVNYADFSRIFATGVRSFLHDGRSLTEQFIDDIQAALKK